LEDLASLLMQQIEDLQIIESETIEKLEKEDEVHMLLNKQIES
jgi:hypothetical protein